MTAADVVISGVGQTAYRGNRGRGATEMSFEGIIAACRDANIAPSEIDGIICYPNSLSAEELVASLGVKRLGYSATIHLGGAAAVASLLHAQLAIRAGLARHIVISRARTNQTGPRVNTAPSQAPGQHFRRQLEEPYGVNTPGQRYAMLCRRYMHEYDLTREQLGMVALAARRHANLNPAAQMHEKPLTMETYLGGRMIADPYLLYDCCLETDGSCAIIVSAADAVRDSRRKAAVRSVAVGHPSSPDDMTNRADFLRIGLEEAAPLAWNAAGMGPDDMNAAMIYDCFTFEVIHQLEAAGFAKHGEGGRFVEVEGIGLDGKLPLNTHGGLLSEAHMLGLNHIIEAVRQIRGEAGARQLAHADRIATIGWGDLGDGAIAVLEGA